MKNSTTAPIRFAEISVDEGGKHVNSFIVTSEDIDEMIYDLEEALAIVDKMEAK